MRSRNCVDASFMLALLTPEALSQAALKEWETWIAEDDQPVAPLLMRYEVASALYRKALQKQISDADARAALAQFLKLDIEWIDLPGMPVRAMELAEQFQRPNTDDAQYLALAESLNCPLWTADERLCNVVQRDFPLIRLLK
jgi:predicted nucleic acid-binding protein